MRPLAADQHHPRHRRPHRPRQDRAGEVPHRLRHRPAQGGERAGHVDRAGLRPLHDRRHAGRHRRRAGPRELHQDDGRRRQRHGRRDPRRGRRRRRHAADPRAPRHPHAAGHPPRHGGADQDRPRRARASRRSSRPSVRRFPARHVSRRRADPAGLERHRRGLRRVSRSALGAGAARSSRDAVDGVFRLPVERAFSVKGYGTVVAGIPVAGSARVGDEVVLLPHGSPGRIRRIEVYGQHSDTVHGRPVRGAQRRPLGPSRDRAAATCSPCPATSRRRSGSSARCGCCRARSCSQERRAR